METNMDASSPDAGNQYQIELIATVIFRISGLSAALYALMFSCHLGVYLGQNHESRPFDKYQSDMFQTYLVDVIFQAISAVVLFAFSKPLARWICRGLLKA